MKDIFKYFLIGSLAVAPLVYQSMFNKKQVRTTKQLVEMYKDLLYSTNENYDDIQALIDCVKKNGLIKPQQ